MSKARKQHKYSFLWCNYGVTKIPLIKQHYNTSYTSYALKPKIISFKKMVSLVLPGVIYFLLIIQYYYISYISYTIKRIKFKINFPLPLTHSIGDPPFWCNGVTQSHFPQLKQPFTKCTVSKTLVYAGVTGRNRSSVRPLHPPPLLPLQPTMLTPSDHEILYHTQPDLVKHA